MIGANIVFGLLLAERQCICAVPTCVHTCSCWACVLQLLLTPISPIRCWLLVGCLTRQSVTCNLLVHLAIVHLLMSVVFQ